MQGYSGKEKRSLSIFVAHEKAIIDACAQHERTNCYLPDYRRCILFFIHITEYHVKFGDSWCFSSEALTQREIASIAQRDPSGAPQAVYHFMTYTFTEFIDTIIVKDIFITVSIFKNNYAPLPFTSSEALERFSNKILSRMHRQQSDLANISIAGEPFVLTQSDTDSSNFDVDATRRPVIFDFGEIGWLLASLANFTLLNTSSFTSDVSVHVFGDSLESVVTSSNLESMYAVKLCLGMTSKSDFGTTTTRQYNPLCRWPSESIEDHRPSLLR
ncbi:hypothetical protein BDN70DRAFT_907325 [Pholiota conissans]|uniref:Uncharacterized protein n=1 Tax=Pholiota conissans TaxID=109636 RepID=A0A9P6CY86_9AGAR|nr:hypothetical protein BDN70DRAFT_907325 [Pholiota conissans]